MDFKLLATPQQLIDLSISYSWLPTSPGQPYQQTNETSQALSQQVGFIDPRAIDCAPQNAYEISHVDVKHPDGVNAPRDSSLDSFLDQSDTVITEAPPPSPKTARNNQEGGSRNRSVNYGTKIRPGHREKQLKTHKHHHLHQQDTNEVPRHATTPGEGVNKRVPHTLVERKYRDTLNAELERLRRAIPHFAEMDDEEVPGRPKPSKATVLANAVTYIKRLEGYVEELEVENQKLRGGTGVLRSSIVSGRKQKRNSII